MFRDDVPARGAGHALFRRVGAACLTRGFLVAGNGCPAVTGSPFLVVGKPFLVVGKPFLVVGKPFLVVGKPFPVVSKAFLVVGKPFPIVSKAFLVVGKPFLVVGKAFLVVGKPFLVVGKPFLVVGKAFLVVGKPFPVVSKAFLVVGKPFPVVRNRRPTASTATVSALPPIPLVLTSPRAGPMLLDRPGPPLHGGLDRRSACYANSCWGRSTAPRSRERIWTTWAR